MTVHRHQSGSIAFNTASEKRLWNEYNQSGLQVLWVVLGVSFQPPEKLKQQEAPNKLFFLIFILTSCLQIFHSNF